MCVCIESLNGRPNHKSYCSAPVGVVRYVWISNSVFVGPVCGPRPSSSVSVEVVWWVWLSGSVFVKPVWGSRPSNIASAAVAWRPWHPRSVFVGPVWDPGSSNSDAGGVAWVLCALHGPTRWWLGAIYQYTPRFIVCIFAIVHDTALRKCASMLCSTIMRLCFLTACLKRGARLGSSGYGALCVVDGSFVAFCKEHREKQMQKMCSGTSQTRAFNCHPLKALRMLVRKVSHRNPQPRKNKGGVSRPQGGTGRYLELRRAPDKTVLHLVLFAMRCTV